MNECNHFHVLGLKGDCNGSRLRIDCAGRKSVLLNISQHQHASPNNTQEHTHTAIAFVFFVVVVFMTSPHYAALSCRLVCSFTPNMASHCAVTQASRPWRSSALSERTHHVFSCFTVCGREKRSRSSARRRDGTCATRCRPALVS